VGWGGESEGKKAKPMSWDENSTTESQREKKITISNTDKKNIQHMLFSLPDAQLAPE